MLAVPWILSTASPPRYLSVPAVEHRGEAHSHIHQSSPYLGCRRVTANAAGEVDGLARVLRPLLDHCASACPADCEHLTDGETWSSESTIHVDVTDLGDESTHCFVCFAERYGKASAALGRMNDGGFGK